VCVCVRVSVCVRVCVCTICSVYIFEFFFSMQKSRKIPLALPLFSSSLHTVDTYECAYRKIKKNQYPSSSHGWSSNTTTAAGETVPDSRDDHTRDVLFVSHVQLDVLHVQRVIVDEEERRRRRSPKNDECEIGVGGSARSHRSRTRENSGRGLEISGGRFEHVARDKR